jgi:hypothetical protein
MRRGRPRLWRARPSGKRVYAGQARNRDGWDVVRGRVSRDGGSMTAVLYLVLCA